MIRRFLKFFRKPFVAFRKPEPAPVTDWRDHPRLIEKASWGQRRSRALRELFVEQHGNLSKPDRVKPYQPVGKARVK